MAHLCFIKLVVFAALLPSAETLARPQPMTALAGGVRQSVSWLDRPPANWNRRMARLPRPGASTPFELRYDPRRIEERRRYTIQARILVGGRLRFINTQAYPVITGGHPDTVNVIVRPVRR